MIDADDGTTIGDTYTKQSLSSSGVTDGKESYNLKHLIASGGIVPSECPSERLLWEPDLFEYREGKTGHALSRPQ